MKDGKKSKTKSWIVFCELRFIEVDIHNIWDGGGSVDLFLIFW